MLQKNERFMLGRDQKRFSFPTVLTPKQIIELETEKFSDYFSKEKERDVLKKMCQIYEAAGLK